MFQKYRAKLKKKIMKTRKKNNECTGRGDVIFYLMYISYFNYEKSSGEKDYKQTQTTDGLIKVGILRSAYWEGWLQF